ncbi:MAG: hypothetical protein EHM37_17285 [Deltaproteobacteria bacterium]|nr:MAG: hypothetical protein EHM37_17285 [Deltaproteobacteria bacterium]
MFAVKEEAAVLARAPEGVGAGAVVSPVVMPGELTTRMAEDWRETPRCRYFPLVSETVILPALQGLPTVSQ